MASAKGALKLGGLRLTVQPSATPVVRIRQVSGLTINLSTFPVLTSGLLRRRAMKQKNRVVYRCGGSAGGQTSA